MLRQFGENFRLDFLVFIHRRRMRSCQCILWPLYS